MKTGGLISAIRAELKSNISSKKAYISVTKSESTGVKIGKNSGFFEDIFNFNQVNEYHDEIGPKSIAKVTYTDHGAIFEFIRDVNVTNSGVAELCFDSDLDGEM